MTPASPHHVSNIRDMRAEELTLLLTSRRHRRLFAAQTAHQLRKVKLATLHATDAAKYTKLGDKIVTKLATIDAAFAVVEADIRKLQALAATLTLTEEELGS